jgi:RND family efflux transporter MFP subunit
MMSQEEALTKAVELELARIGHATAEFRLSQKRITSPLSGIVVKKHKESGESVTRVDKLFDIVNIDKVYLQFYLDPVLMQRIQRDAKVKVVFPTLPDKEEFIAVVSFVDPVIDAGSGLFRVKLLMDNPGHRIKAGMRVEADFTRPAETAQ